MRAKAPAVDRTKPYYTIKEIAHIMGLTEWTARHLAKTKRLGFPAKRIGGQWRIPSRPVNTFLEGNS